MIERDRAEFAEVVGAVFTYYGKDLSASVLEIYWEGLRQYDLLAIRGALGRHAKNPDTGAFLPKIADVEKMLGGTTLDSGLVAWSKVAKAIESVGSYYTVVFDDALIHRVLEEMGGWVELCRVTTKELPFKQNEFVNRYRGYRMRSEVPTYPARLIGIFDGENSAAGYAVGDENVRMIGVARAAKLVLAGGSSTPRLGISTLAEAATMALADKSRTS